MDPSTLSFILFSCPLTPWVRCLILRTDLWSDGITHPLGNTLWLTSYPEAINVVGTRDMFLVVIHSNRSVSSSHVSFPLYICCLHFIFYFLQQISNQSATIHSFTLLFRLLGVTVLYTFPVAFFTSSNCKYSTIYAKFSLCFAIYSNIACPSST